MTDRPTNCDDSPDDIYRTIGTMAHARASDNGHSPVMFGLFVLGLFGSGAAAVVLSALAAAH